MDIELDKKLCKEFPEIFRDRDNKPLEIFGIECGNGWYPLIRMLCKQLTKQYRNLEYKYHNCLEMLEVTDKSKWKDYHYKLYSVEKLEGYKLALEQSIVPKAVQIKEKFGELRFYVDTCNKDQEKYITQAEYMSNYVCEECATMNRVYTFSMGWMRTLCIPCALNRYGEEKVREFIGTDNAN